mmetsp:Transcript_36203/g.55323  ORF Transcript_36203/g.55323 Transcript_36203/m.55323 type:complete len:262 (+) Transcript_36203:3408-4193(+)
MTEPDNKGLDCGGGHEEEPSLLFFFFFFFKGFLRIELVEAVEEARDKADAGGFFGGSDLSRGVTGAVFSALAAAAAALVASSMRIGEVSHVVAGDTSDTLLLVIILSSQLKTTLLSLIATAAALSDMTSASYKFSSDSATCASELSSAAMSADEASSLTIGSSIGTGGILVLSSNFVISFAVSERASLSDPVSFSAICPSQDPSFSAFIDLPELMSELPGTTTPEEELSASTATMFISDPTHKTGSVSSSLLVAELSIVGE